MLNQSLRLAGLVVLVSGACGGAPAVGGGRPSVVAGGSWGASAALSREVAPTDVVSKPGELHGPASLAAHGTDVLILDPIGGRLVRLAAAGGAFAEYDQSSAYLGALDLTMSAGGDQWLLGATSCQCARHVTGGGGAGLDLPIASSLYPGRLAVDGDDLLIAAFDGLHVVAHGGAPLSAADQVATTRAGITHPVLGVVVAARIRDGAVHVVGTRADASVAFDWTVDVQGMPAEIRLAAPACGDSTLVVVTVAGSGGLADVMVRLGANGQPRNRIVVPFAADYGTGTIPFRSFAATDGGKLYQLTTGGGGYAIASWPTGC